MTRFRRLSLGTSLSWMFAWFAALVPSAPVFATDVVLKDGRVLHGKLGETTGVADSLALQGLDTEGPGPTILLMDDDLSRIFVSKRLVKDVRQDEGGQGEEKFSLHQRPMHNGQTIRSVGPPMRVQPFDDFGRRVFTMYTAKGPVDIIQGITELTPHWAKVEGITHVWDMRIATNSIPRDELQKILAKQINRKDLESYKKIARFYLQAERYAEAHQALEDLIKAFPDRKDLGEQLAPSLRAVKQLSAQQLLAELKLRRAAGQHALVWEGLKKFPSDDVGGEILQGARDLLDEYEVKSARCAKTIEKLDALLPKIRDQYQREQLGKFRDELAAELGFNTIDRMAAFLQNADDPQMPVQEKMALALSGWLLGSDSAVEQLPVALSVYNLRGQVRDYLVEPTRIKREQILDGLKSQEGASPALVADLLSHMKPALHMPPMVSPEKPGYYKLEVPCLTKEPPVTYWVQIPPEYDPYKLYPAVVTLNGAANTAESQLDWWAGDWVKSGQAAEKAERGPDAPSDAPKPAAVPAENAPPPAMSRSGHAGRYGTIVIAPEWTVEHQKQYGYSAREHTAVLNSLRDACRRFSIDTDRVYLSGYSIGGDAAWDIGLAHPDLWAGVIPISAQSDKYCNFYSENAKYVPFYVILGELDGSKINKNAMDLDRYLKRAYDATLVEYQGRGHDDFHEEILRIFDWMARFHRNFFPREFACYTMRDWDCFFWWIELDGLPPKTQVDPEHWPPSARMRPAQIKGKITGNNISVVAPNAQASIWLSPQMIDFKQRSSITVNGQPIYAKESFLQPEVRTMLEDVRTRGDRQHPFWLRLDSAASRTRSK